MTKKKTLKNEKNEKDTLLDLEYGEKIEKNVLNKTQTLYNLEYGKKH